LATALRSVAGQREFVWVGSPGCPVEREERASAGAVLAEHGVPVFLDEAEIEGFYEQLSNRFLWPLFHGIPNPIQFDREAWAVYQRVNRRFADTIAEIAEPGDSVWVHDYQLALLPGILRERGLDCGIGFFLHIPFPSSGIFRTLPVREEILAGMVGADYVGFHAYEYVGNFRSSLIRVLGYESDPDHVMLPTHSAFLGVLPIGIEPRELEGMGERADVVEQGATLAAEYAGLKVVLGVDRLDYTKGIPSKLLAIEELLRERPELHEKFVFIQVAAPSRTTVEEYRALKREIDELVGRINGEFGTLDWTPVVYINQNLPREQLVALYRRAEVMLVTPLRDGMNLVCLEYIAARKDVPGTLILSEFAGAASCLSGAILVNPHNPSQICASLAKALTEREPSSVAFHHMQEFVYSNTSATWAERFLVNLEESIAKNSAKLVQLSVRASPSAELIAASKQPMVFLDYDGTLTPHTRLPSDASPSPQLLAALERLAASVGVYIVSGRPAETLEAWLGALDLGFVCEHGLAIRRRGSTIWESRHDEGNRTLQETVEPIMRSVGVRTPGSRTEQKKASIAWHYRGSDPKLGVWRARELQSLLESQLSGQPYVVMAGSRVVEVCHGHLTKGAAVREVLALHPGVDYVFCAGNDRTDEDMFLALRDLGIARTVCSVGRAHSSAEFFVDSPGELLLELEELASIFESR
jgi:trehalose 6-phosphate synthase/phosphatase